MFRGLLFIFLFFGVFRIEGQLSNLKFRHITSKDGLVQNNVVSILQDSKGFMWFGTRAGLNRYDGYDFQLYEHVPGNDNSLSSSQISSMYEDNQGYIWIGHAGGGLDRYDPETDSFENFNKFPESSIELPNSNLAAIVEDDQQNLWLGIFGHGLYKINKERTRLAKVVHDSGRSQEMRSNSISSLLKDSKGNLWIGFWFEKRIDRYDPVTGEVEHFMLHSNKAETVSESGFFDMYEDSSGRIWFAMRDSGVSCYCPEENSFEHFSHDPSDPNSLSSDVVRAIVEDDRGYIWFGTENGGLSIFNPSTRRFHNLFFDDLDNESLNNNSIYSLYKDFDNNIWVGTYTGGVNVYFKSYNTFEHFRKKSVDNSLSHNSVTSFVEDYFGKIWVGTDGGGLNVIDLEKKSIKAFRSRRNDPTSLGGDFVMGVSKDSRNNIWVSTWGGGLSRYDFRTGNFTRYLKDDSDENSINSNNVSTAFEDSSGDLWVGTFGGGLNLFDYETKEFKSFAVEAGNEQSISNNNVINILEGDKNLLWIGTDGGGINMLRRNHTFRRFLGIEGGNNGLQNGNILSSLKDHKGGLWFGTNKGLHKLNPDNLHFYHYPLGNRLSDLRVLGIEEDDDHNLWISSNDGLIVYNPETKYFRRFSRAYGLQDIEFTRGASYKDSEGYLYFGGINGFNRFHPDSVKVNVDPPRIEIVDLEIFNQSVRIGEMDSILKKSITETDYIEIPSRYSMFSLEYVALNYNFSEDIEYAYMLENFDKEWYYVGKGREVTYTNLNPGKYEFKIKCKVDGEEWGQEQRKLEIVILPSFWQTFWFKALIFLVIILVSTAFVRSRMKRIQKLNSLVDKRTEEIRQQNNVLEDQKKQLTRINSMLTDRQEKIEAQTKELYQQRNKLKQTNATKDKFLSIIAHDLRNPFNTIIGFSELLLMGFKSYRQDEVEEQLKHILHSAEQTYNLLEDLLLWANSQSGKMVTHLTNVNVKEVCEQVISLLNDQGKRKNITIQLSGDDVLAKADRFMLKTIIRNLLSNAIKFTDEGGRVDIFVRKDIDNVVVSVVDNGLGMDSLHLRKLWDIAGQTSRPGTDNEQGSGLGLLLCKEFVEKQGGRISVESKPGKGSNFFFTVPAVD